MQYLVSEFFDLLEKQPTKEGKIGFLRQHNNDVVRTMLRFNFDYNLKWSLPEGEPPYTKILDRPMGFEQTTLQRELRRMYIWVNTSENISQLKREALFVSMLEGLHHTEAEIMCLVKDGKLETKYPSITHELIMEAFPGLLPAPRPKPEPEKVVKKSRTKKSLQQSAVM